MQLAVNILVFDQGRLLALKAKEEGFYCLPKAYLRSDETLVQAAKRGLRKETGIDAADLHFVGIYDALSRNPAYREIAAVLLARSWHEVPGEEDRQAKIHWIHDLGKPFILDQAQMLTEQRMFAPLSRRVLPPVIVRTDA
jgi:ADP-ribose pyrophosphatase YjhB (NUDIX family)